MNLKNLVLLIALPLFICSACELDTTRGTVTLQLPNFNSLVIGENMNANIYYGPQQVIIGGSGNLTSVTYFLNRNELTLTNSGGDTDVIVNVYVPNLTKVTCKENCKVNFPKGFVTKSNFLELTGQNSASIRMHEDVAIETIDISLYDASNLAIDNLLSSSAFCTLNNGTHANMEGYSNKFFLEMTGGTHFNMNFPDDEWKLSYPMSSDTCIANVRNGAHAWISPIFYLDATITDGSRIYHYGIPEIIEEKLENGGELLPKNI